MHTHWRYVYEPAHLLHSGLFLFYIYLTSSWNRCNIACTFIFILFGCSSHWNRIVRFPHIHNFDSVVTSVCFSQRIIEIDLFSFVFFFFLASLSSSFSLFRSVFYFLLFLPPLSPMLLTLIRQFSFVLCFILFLFLVAFISLIFPGGPWIYWCAEQ